MSGGGQQKGGTGIGEAMAGSPHPFQQEQEPQFKATSLHPTFSGDEKAQPAPSEAKIDLVREDEPAKAATESATFAQRKA